MANLKLDDIAWLNPEAETIKLTDLVTWYNGNIYFVNLLLKICLIFKNTIVF